MGPPFFNFKTWAYRATFFQFLILRLYYSSEPNCAELNHAGPAVQTVLAWFGPVYTVKQTGLTCAGPQKCASVNIV